MAFFGQPEIRFFLTMLLSFFTTLPAQATSASFKKVMVVIFENADYQDALKQPYFSELAKQGALFTNFIAETHPSQPNYLALIAGDTMGVRGDGNADVDGTHIGDLLEKKGKTWKV